MKLTQNLSTTSGSGCHCGAVRFKVIEYKYKTINCNCSICQKKGFLELMVPQDQFTLLHGADKLTTYTFNSGIDQQKFCQICGTHSFYIPRSHLDSIDVNLRCLDGNAVVNFDIEAFDGANWEQNIEKIII